MYRLFSRFSLILVLFISAFGMVSCNPDPDPEPDFKINASQLEGVWVYNHPEKGIWEEQKFLTNGVFYFSNRVTGEFSFSNKLVDGEYKIFDNDQVEFTYSVNGTPFTLTMKVSEITNYSYTADYNDGTSLGTFTYAKLLDSYYMQHGESLQPDYSDYVKVNITGYRSHDEKIAVVNYQNGEITAVSAGRTYIDVVTEEGTAVVEILVDANWTALTKNIGKNRDGVVAEYGQPFYEDASSIYYMNEDDPTIMILAFSLSASTSNVYAISAFLQENVSFESMFNLLSEEFYYYEKGTKPEESYFAFTNKETLSESNIGITFDWVQGLITFVDLTANQGRNAMNESFMDLSKEIMEKIQSIR